MDNVETVLVIPVRCRTNLDLVGESWPTHLPAIPRIGERIRSRTKWGIFQLELEVVAVKWVPSGDGYIAEVELHIPVSRNWSLVDFYKWYAPKVGKTVSSFI